MVSTTATARLHCGQPSDLATVVFDVVLMVTDFVCILIVCYGLLKYVQFWRTAQGSYLRPPKYIHRVGLVFFGISFLTLFNAFMYNLFYLTCQELDEYEGPIYHMVYFAQIYSLWIMLFSRAHFVFSNTQFRLSKCTVLTYATCFVVVPFLVASSLALIGLKSEFYVTLPYIVFSSVVCLSLLLVFLHKLSQLFSNMSVDSDVMRSATKTTLLAVVSIGCSLLVVAILCALFIRHHGNMNTHTVFEELMLELAILVDIVSNFICVLLSYKFFDKPYYKMCGVLDKKLEFCFRTSMHDDSRILSEIITCSPAQSSAFGSTATSRAAATISNPMSGTEEEHQFDRPFSQVRTARPSLSPFKSDPGRKKASMLRRQLQPSEATRSYPSLL